MKFKKIKFLFLLSIGIIYSQENQKRMEFDLKDDFENEIVFPLGENGLLLQSFNVDSKKGQIEFKNDFYTNDFKLAKTELINVKERTSYVDSYSENGINYTLIRNKRDYFSIIKSDSKNLACSKVEGEYSDDASMLTMKVYDNKAIFKSVEDNLDKIIIVDLITGGVKEIPFKFGDYRRKDISIKDFQIMEDEILVFVNAKSDRKTTDLFITKLSLSGEQKDFYCITNDITEKLITVAATKFNDKYILTGTYSKDKSDMSQGVFIGEVQNKKVNFMKFYNFVDLKNFTEYLSDKQQKKIERKKNAKEERGKELLLNYNIATHPIKLVEDGYEFLGEAFYPVYTYYPCGHMGRSMCSRFLGYQYTHATLAKFDLTGNLKWDNTFEMYPSYLPTTVKKFITMDQDKNTINLVFGNGSQIKYKVFNSNNGTIEKDSTQEIIDTNLKDDKVKSSYSNVEYWYNNNYIAYGIQKISNNEVKRKRKVFFINKVTLNK